MAFDHWSPTGCIKATRYEATDSGFARVTKLFLPPGHDSFGCRQCHDLSYRTVQENDQRVDKLVKNPLLCPGPLEVQSKT